MIEITSFEVKKKNILTIFKNIIKGDIGDFSIGMGWFNLIMKLLDRIEKILEKDEYIEIFQIKEKFGVLRFYFDTNSKHREEINKIVFQTEEESTTTCENCGESGKTGGSYWLKTLCNKCNKEK